MDNSVTNIGSVNTTGSNTGPRETKIHKYLGVQIDYRPNK